jgi:hypothetical protein
MIQRLAVVLLLPLTGCATQDPTAAGPEAQASAQASIQTGALVRQVVRPLPPAPPGAGPRTFAAEGMQGWVRESGAWGIRAEVAHAGLRCATYELGGQIGRGDSSCTAVSWLGGIDFATRLTHCNGAVRIHAGEGNLRVDTKTVATANCVRVVTRCSGGC